ncbi:MAG TPA: S8 family serine peptidase, partial [Anaerolineae bacterium]|nr:S8 family serine peptidase [Anaerolineae bacterium]
MNATSSYNKFILLISTCFIPLILIFGLTTTTYSCPPQSQTCSPQTFPTQLSSKPIHSGTTPYILHFQSDTAAYPLNTTNHQTLYQTLTNQYQTNLQLINPLLLRLQQQQQLTITHHLWLINALALELTPAAATTIRQHPTTATLTPDQLRHYTLSPTHLTPTNSPSTPWHIDHLQLNHVWHGLNITGTNSTIAIFDTGVDGHHPNLATNYRGYQQTDQASHWFDPIDNTPFPFDPNGHGTHVASTAVGAPPIGLAPGATWIAARVFNRNGGALDSHILAAFQWIFAPNNDPNLAPDFVNNSWTSSPTNLTFYQAVTLLQQAGITPIFAAGNSGPNPATIGAPANYTNTLSVGATDDYDQLAWFSGRGPSIFTPQPKPLLFAPGTHILAAQPDNSYGYKNGTSMATPQVVGTFALLHAANPQLTPAQLTYIITSTQQNGRIAPYHALAATPNTNFATLHGRLLNHLNIPLAHTPLTITNLSYTTDHLGHFTATLAPGTYTLNTTP